MNFIFPSIGNVIIPTDFQSIIFQRVFLLNHQPEKWQTFTNINQQLPTLNQHLTNT